MKKENWFEKYYMLEEVVLSNNSEIIDKKEYAKCYSLNESKYIAWCRYKEYSKEEQEKIDIYITEITYDKVFKSEYECEFVLSIKDFLKSNNTEIVFEELKNTYNFYLNKIMSITEKIGAGNTNIDIINTIIKEEFSTSSTIFENDLNDIVQNGFCYVLTDGTILKVEIEIVELKNISLFSTVKLKDMYIKDEFYSTDWRCKNE